MLSTILLSELRAKVTDASADYLGSVMIHEEMCRALGFQERQLVHIRSQQTGVELWTYVIRGRSDDVNYCAHGAVCLNGASANLVNVGDIVYISAHGMITAEAETQPTIIKPRFWDAVQHGVNDIVEQLGVPDVLWAKDVLLEYANGKIHRPRITDVVQFESSASALNSTIAPSVYMDEDWARQGGIHEGEIIHFVNITNGQRDILTLRYAPRKSQQCSVHLAESACVFGSSSRPGHNVGDVVIALSYRHLSRATILKGEMPQMKIAFPCERPRDAAATALNRMWDLSTNVMWDKSDALVQGLIDTLQLQPGMKVLDCACGTGFLGFALLRAGLDAHLSDGSPHVVELAKNNAKALRHIATDTSNYIRVATWEELPQVWGSEQFDMIICRGNSLPFVQSWEFPSMSHTLSSREGYKQLVKSIKGIFETLKPDGMLYVDCLPEVNSEVSKEGSTADGRVRVEWNFTANEKERRQLWNSTVNINHNGHPDDVEVFKTSISGCLVREKEIKCIMAYAGFGYVSEVCCPGESVYRSFVVQKPNKVMEYYDRQINRYRRVWNENGKMCYGLCDGIWPTTDSELWQQLSLTQGEGAMVGPNLALQAYMLSKLRGINIASILDVGCGTGRSSLDLAKKYPLASIAGWDPSEVNIQRAEEMAKMEGLTNVKFFHGFVQDLEQNNSMREHKKLHSAAWSEAALCHAPPESRIEALQSISYLLETGGVFVLNDTLAGAAQPVSPKAQLHVLERLGFVGLWDACQYMDVLESVGLAVQEFVDLSEHQARSYELLSKEARRAAEDAWSRKDRKSEQVYTTLARDYMISAATIREGHWGWGLFVCRRRKQPSASQIPAES